MSFPRHLVPSSTFRCHSRQLQQIRHLSTPDTASQHSTVNTAAEKRTTVQSPLNLFPQPSSIIKPWKALAGAREWQTSTYTYNKNTSKTLPTASATADKLLQDYTTMIQGRGTASSASSSTARNAIAIRRKSAEKIYISGTSVKDFGDKIVVDAYVYDGIEAAKDEKNRKDQGKKAAGQAKPDRRRRAPSVTAPAGRSGGAMGMSRRPPPRALGTPRAAGSDKPSTGPTFRRLNLGSNTPGREK